MRPEILLGSVQDDNVNIRYWAVEGLAYLGTDEVIAPLLDTFRNDPSPMIRERAACGLAQSGMLSERQRRTAVPRLLDFADDAALDAETRKWVFQALRDITGQTLAARCCRLEELVQLRRRRLASGDPRPDVNSVLAIGSELVDLLLRALPDCFLELIVPAIGCQHLQ